jgi:hypothetical protein
MPWPEVVLISVIGTWCPSLDSDVYGEVFYPDLPMEAGKALHGLAVCQDPSKRQVIERFEAIGLTILWGFPYLEQVAGREPLCRPISLGIRFWNSLLYVIWGVLIAVLS